MGTMNILAMTKCFFGCFDLENAIFTLRYGGRHKIFYKVHSKNFNNELIFMYTENGVKLLIDQYEKCENVEVYIEYLSS